MAVPKFEDMLHPLLQEISDGQQCTVQQVRAKLADSFRLTSKDLHERLSSGKRRFNNRVNWAVTHLSKAGLLTRPARGHIKITDRGCKALSEATPIDFSYLRQHPEYREFRNLSPEGPAPVEQTDKTPQETLDQAYQAPH